MKKILCLLLALASVFAFASCSQDDGTPDGYKLASNDEACKYSLYVPENWVASDGESKTNFTQATVSNADSCNISFSPVNDLAMGDGLDEFWAKEEAKYKILFPDFTLLSAKEVVAFGGANGYRYIFTASFGGTEYKFMQIFVPKSEIFTAELYAFTYTARTEMAAGKDVSHYDEHLETVNQIISYFKWD